ncbi:aspartyl/asparaginyl beta-hydroxylase domain-containing protein [Paraburkholderia sp. A1RI_3L]|uniref:aspartyl/asparaginyl beta-hydroxylase domain-containing protein n=1 Tax=Paraburkholderia TaxID=1822464 RepID=UPI003B7F602E
MRTHRVKTLELDLSRLMPEVENALRFPYSEAYSDYLCGGPWKSCMLWTTDGRQGDGYIANYGPQARGSKTPYADRMPYLWGLVEQTFDLAHLSFARLAVISNSVIIPHKDLLELGKLLNRAHVPLVTNDRCFFSEGDVVYRMKPGEVWFFDAARMHSAASFSEAKRMHLVLDFADVPHPERFVKEAPAVAPVIPEDSIVRRSSASAELRAQLAALARVIDASNYRDVFSIVIRKHYEFDGGENFVWETMLQIAAESRNAEVQRRIGDMYTYFIEKRAA